jgi:hypothetical protein
VITENVLKTWVDEHEILGNVLKMCVDDVISGKERFEKCQCGNDHVITRNVLKTSEN